MRAFSLVIAIFLSIIVVISATNEFVTKLWDSFELVKKYAEEKLSASGAPYAPSPDYPYWNFMPEYQLSFSLTGTPAIWTSRCFKVNIGSLKKNDDEKTYTLSIKSSSPVDETGTCTDDYLALTTSTFNDILVSSTSLRSIVTTEVVISFPDDITEAEVWDREVKGVRLFLFANSAATTLSNILKTFETFIPEFTKRVPTKVAELNIDLLQKYSQFEIQPRDPLSGLPPNAKDVHSGDFFGIMRLDGLNPLLGWAMGSTTGHTTVALWIDGVLNVCESTIDDSYWPTDGVQCTEYQKWLKQCQEADFQVVWAPLTETARASFNETAAVEFFRSVEGLNYGFKTLLWSWLDTTSSNFPCLPSDYTNCLTWDLAEPLLAYVDRKVPEIGYMIWNSGIAMRLGVSDNLRTADLYWESAKQGIKSNDLITIPEQDSWLYNTTKFDEPAVGKNMVCCVFVCNMWKAAGVFGALASDIQCGELTNWDDYSLNILQKDYRQIIGDYTLKLNDYGTKTPYSHLAETCPSLAPDYIRSSTC